MLSDGGAVQVYGHGTDIVIAENTADRMTGFVAWGQWRGAPNLTATATAVVPGTAGGAKLSRRSAADSSSRTTAATTIDGSGGGGSDGGGSGGGGGGGGGGVDDGGGGGGSDGPAARLGGAFGVGMNPTTHVQMIGNEVREGNNVVNVWYTNTSGTTCVHVCVCRELRAHGDGVRPSVLRPQPPPSPTRAPCPALPCPASQPASQPPALARSLALIRTPASRSPRVVPLLFFPLVRSSAAATTTRGLGCTARAWPTSWTSTASRSWTGAWAR